VGLRVFLVISGLSAASGLLLLGLVLEWKSYPLLLAGMMLAGYGTATGAFGATVAATQDVADDEQGLAGGLVNMSRQVGAALGVTLAAAAIGAGAASGGSVGPDRSAVLLTFLAAALASVIAFYGLGTRIQAVSTDRITSGPLESAPVGVVASQHIDYAEGEEPRCLETRGRGNRTLLPHHLAEVLEPHEQRRVAVRADAKGLHPEQSANGIERGSDVDLEMRVDAVIEHVPSAMVIRLSVSSLSG